jgi:hypothetical protein
MTAIALLKFAHILGFVYWLGTDLGVWYSSYYAADRNLSPETRVTVIRILLALDLSPRICMTLMLPVGIQLGYWFGLLPMVSWIIVALWLLSLGWLATVLYLHFGPKGAGSQLLARIDFGFRLAVITALATYATFSLFGFSDAQADWVAWKLLIFAAMIGCGLMIRIRLAPFGPAFARLAAGNATEADDETIERSIAATRPWVLLIWLGLLFSAALGLRLF